MDKWSVLLFRQVLYIESMKRTISLALLISLLAACTVSISTNKAENTMRSFFTALVERDYQTAANLFGGSYTELAQMNPDTSPTDHVTLWQRGCEQNGFVCMEVLDIVRVEMKGSQVKFGVTFRTKDGNQFEFTGCCGETLPIAITEYVIVVEKEADGNYKVLSLPPYVP